MIDIFGWGYERYTEYYLHFQSINIIKYIENPNLCELFESALQILLDIHNFFNNSYNEHNYDDILNNAKAQSAEKFSTTETSLCPCSKGTSQQLFQEPIKSIKQE